MSITMKELAILAGVSRSTVDRVLNKRGRVDKVKEKKILELADKMGYQPNVVAKTLVMSKKGYKVLCIPSFSNVEFCNQICKGIDVAAREASIFGLNIELVPLHYIDADAQLDLIRQICPDEYSAIIITPLNDRRISDALQKLVEKKLIVVALTANIEHVDSFSFVGIDHVQSGKLAGNLFRLTAQNKPLRILAIIGSQKMLSHVQRVDGLRTYCKENAPNLQIVDVIENHEDDTKAYIALSKYLSTNPVIDAVFFAGDGIEGSMNAIESLCKRKPMIIGYDLEVKRASRERLMRNEFLFSISQRPYEQGYAAVRLVSDYLIYNRAPKGNTRYTEPEIVVAESLNFSRRGI